MPTRRQSLLLSFLPPHFLSQTFSLFPHFSSTFNFNLMHNISSFTLINKPLTLRLSPPTQLSFPFNPTIFLHFFPPRPFSLSYIFPLFLHHSQPLHQMARFFTFFLLLLSVLSASLCSFSDARMLHLGKQRSRPNATPSSADGLFLSALPKGTVPSSTPSKKGHAVVVDEKLIARHLIAIDRLLRSVPSPGAGH